MLVGKAMKISVSETVFEFKNKSEDRLIVRINRIISNIIKRTKFELAHIWTDIKEFAVNNAISEIINLILNYFVSTVKNIFKLIRCLFGSIIKAFKIILDSTKPWEDRLFEALKIISAGIAMATGTMLNELIGKAIATNIPFLAGYASDISAVISGLISSILSALVLMSFDRYKASLQIKDEERKMQLLKLQLLGNNLIQSQISTVKSNIIVAQTTELVKLELSSIIEHNKEIEASIIRKHKLHQEIDIIKDKITDAQNLLSINRNKCNNNIDNLLNNLPPLE